MILTNFRSASTIRISRESAIAQADRLMPGCSTIGIRAAQAWTGIEALLLSPTGLVLRAVRAGGALGSAAADWVALRVSRSTIARGNAVLLNAVGVYSAR